MCPYPTPPRVLFIGSVKRRSPRLVWVLNGGDLAATFIPNVGNQACTPIHSPLSLSYTANFGSLVDLVSAYDPTI